MSNKNDLEKLSVIVPKFYIKSRTNSGDIGKQSFLVIRGDISEPSLIIRKLALSSDFSLFKEFKLLKRFKDNGLFEQRFSIKLSTLKIVIDSLNDIKIR